MLLQWGRNVSQFQGLPLFEISFSCLLGMSFNVLFPLFFHLSKMSQDCSGILLYSYILIRKAISQTKALEPI